MNVFEKLANVQASLKAPKGQYNTFGKYNYRSCEDIVESAKPLLKENGLLLTLADEIVPIGERFYVKATATIIDTAEGKTVSVSAFAREEEAKKGMDGSQVTGASSSYARKYALNGLFAIDDTKDSDATNTNGNNNGNGNKHPTQPTQTNQQQGTNPKTNQKQGEQPQQSPRKMLIARLSALGIDVNAYAAQKGLNKNTTQERYKELLAELG